MLDVMNIYLVIYKSIIYIYIQYIYSNNTYTIYIYHIFRVLPSGSDDSFFAKKKWAFFCIGSVKSTQLFTTE